MQTEFDISRKDISLFRKLEELLLEMWRSVLYHIRWWKILYFHVLLTELPTLSTSIQDSLQYIMLQSSKNHTKYWFLNYLSNEEHSLKKINSILLFQVPVVAERVFCVQMRMLVFASFRSFAIFLSNVSQSCLTRVKVIIQNLSSNSTNQYINFPK